MGQVTIRSIFSFHSNLRPHYHSTTDATHHVESSYALGAVEARLILMRFPRPTHARRHRLTRRRKMEEVFFITSAGRRGLMKSAEPAAAIFRALLVLCQLRASRAPRDIAFFVVVLNVSALSHGHSPAAASPCTKDASETSPGSC